MVLVSRFNHSFRRLKNFDAKELTIETLGPLVHRTTWTVRTTTLLAFQCMVFDWDLPLWQSNSCDTRALLCLGSRLQICCNCMTGALTGTLTAQLAETFDHSHQSNRYPRPLSRELRNVCGFIIKTLNMNFLWLSVRFEIRLAVCTSLNSCFFQ